MPTYSNEALEQALEAIRADRDLSTTRAAKLFGVPKSTLQNRLKNGKTRAISHESQQLLTSIEEEQLVAYVSRASKLGSPITLPILLELATEIREKRRLTPSTSPPLPPISRRWTERFRDRHPSLKVVLTRSIDSQRANGANYAAIKHYFDELSKVISKERYPPNAIFNVDETGFSIGSTSTF
jgi:hypothetical protein